MPRFYFDAFDDHPPFRDDSGMELKGNEEARLTAIEALPDLAREFVPQHGDSRCFVVKVRTEQGRYIYSASLRFDGAWIDEDVPPKSEESV